MAVTLTVDLTDIEQAKLAEVVAIIAPGATPLQVKNWAERTMKRCLRDAVRARYNQWLHEQEEAERQAEMNQWDTEWQAPPEGGV